MQIVRRAGVGPGLGPVGMRTEMRPPAIFADGVSVTVTLYAGSFLTAEDQAWLSLLGHLDPPERATLRSPAVRD